MARLAISAGETKTLVAAGDRPVFIRSFLIKTNGADDATLIIQDKFGDVFPGGGFVTNGPDDHGGMAQFAEAVEGPCKVTLTGTGSTAKIYYREVF